MNEPDPQTAAFEAEGLLDGLDPAEREARLDLLRQLAEAGVSIEAMKRAVAEDRLAMVPIELVFTRECKYTLPQAMEQSGLSEGFVRRDLLALGLPYPADDELLYTDEDLESFKAVRQVLDTGLPEERMLELARIAGRSAAQSAEAILLTFVRQFLHAGDTDQPQSQVDGPDGERATYHAQSRLQPHTLVAQIHPAHYGLWYCDKVGEHEVECEKGAGKPDRGIQFRRYFGNSRRKPHQNRSGNY